MSNRIKPGVVVAACVSLLIAGFTTRLDAQKRCGDASLRGSYAFKVDGANISNPHLPVGPFAAVGKNTYDGNGRMRGAITLSLNGSIIHDTYAGTYTVEPDCTGVKTATLAVTGAVVEFAFVIDDDLREIQMMVTKAGMPRSLVEGLAVSGSASKLFTNRGDK